MPKEAFLGWARIANWRRLAEAWGVAAEFEEYLNVVRAERFL